MLVLRFLPTPSARRATHSTIRRNRTLYISTHALREEGDFHPIIYSILTPISTHALREEGDLLPTCYQPLFQISTHALREEGDVPAVVGSLTTPNFYPRPPRGGRR